MPRIRTIKPSFWTDEITGRFSDRAKLLFLGLLQLADDYGVVKFSAAEWRAQLFPYDPVRANDDLLRCLMDEILPTGVIQLFSVGGDEGRVCTYLFITNFGRHQVVARPSQPTLAAWQKGDTPTTYAERIGAECHELGVAGSMMSTEHSLPEGKGREGKGKERKGGEGNATADAEASPAAVDPDFFLETWNETASFSPARSMTPKLIAALAARCRDPIWRQLWRQALCKLPQSSFLRGERPRDGRDWRADIDWFLKPDSVSKILEGKYDDRAPTVDLLAGVKLRDPP
jgi:hypothetical protein